MKFAFIFPGQGSQKIGMGREIYDKFAIARQILEQCSDECGIDFKNLLFENNDKLNISEFTQPAILLNSMMNFAVLKDQIQIKQEFSFGHSLGEFSALSANNAFEIQKAAKLVNLRGKFMQKSCENKNASMMVILGLKDDIVEQICKNALSNGAQIYAANYNCDGQIVIAGLKEDLEKFALVFKDAGAKRAMLLNMSVASHCPLLQSACDDLAVEIDKFINQNFLKVISNVSAKFYDTKIDALKMLKTQLTSPVLYKQSVKFAEDKVDVFVEFGACVLSGLNKKITQKPTYSVFDLKTLDEFCEFVEKNR